MEQAARMCMEVRNEESEEGTAEVLWQNTSMAEQCSQALAGRGLYIILCSFSTGIQVQSCSRGKLPPKDTMIAFRKLL